MFHLLVGLALFYAFFNGYRDSSSILAGVIASRAMRPSSGAVSGRRSRADRAVPLWLGRGALGHDGTGGCDCDQPEHGRDRDGRRRAVEPLLLVAGHTVVVNACSDRRPGGRDMDHSRPAGGSRRGLLRAVLPLMAAPWLASCSGSWGWGCCCWSSAAPHRGSIRCSAGFRSITAVLLAMSNSANDSHKSMGIIALGLVLAGRAASFEVPLWALAACADGDGLRRLARRLASDPKSGRQGLSNSTLNALASQLAATAVVFTASALGMPVSTSHIISTSLMGSGASERVNKVRWHVAGEMATAWILTIPATMAVAVPYSWHRTGSASAGGDLDSPADAAESKARPAGRAFAACSVQPDYFFFPNFAVSRSCRVGLPSSCSS